LNTLTIKLHHWAITGFERWKGDMKLLDKNTTEYGAYAEKRKRVSNLENKMINDFAGTHLLNKTTAKGKDQLTKDEINFYNAVAKIIQHK